MELRWSDDALNDLNYWKKNDAAKVKKIKALLENIIETPYKGLGKPEPLKFDWSGYWSRRINSEHRLIYKYTDEYIEIVSCRFHYTK
ncbi:Txe/YoeB family addiction module toxin [Enterococcus plantarum]|uniref:Txe/YoeB family addiction module toxin n=1 Tax=Enterococcus plantarum TaxID=1077675 RepID=UPI000A350717|nr:Txe/YoeB family addiction module toxin [Enterococcus plantarum]MBO0422697.1 Txe/YoeB family addiction module toxin [Enterococcus plantarum]OTP46815.1 txe/YoeB family addiction module toxin [Enterococcus termitis]